MALAHSQVYTFAHAQDTPAFRQVTAPSTLYIPYQKNTAFNFKQVMVGDSSVFSMESSSNGSTFGTNDQVDHWTTSSALTDTGTKWFVLRAGAGLGSCEILVHTGTGSNTISRIGIYFSPTGAFTGGGATTRPTAVDEVSYMTSHDLFGSLTSLTRYNMHSSHGADGLQWQMVNRTNSKTSLFMRVAKVVNAPAALDNGVVWAFLEEGGNNEEDIVGVTQHSLWDNTQNFFGSVSGTVLGMYLGSRGFDNTNLAESQRVQADNKMFLSPCDLWISAVSDQGYYGTVPDLFYGAVNHFAVLLGDTVGGLANWMSDDALVFLWDNTEPLPRGY